MCGPPPCMVSFICLVSITPTGIGVAYFSLELTMKMDAQEMAMCTMHVAIHVIAWSAPNACVELIPLSSTPRDLALQH